MNIIKMIKKWLYRGYCFLYGIGFIFLFFLYYGYLRIRGVGDKRKNYIRLLDE
jgi:hypothetical protein